MKTYYYLILVTLLFPMSLFSQELKIDQAPLIWLRADMIGDSIGQWQDCRQNGFKASTQNNQVLSSDSLFNFQETFYFDGMQKPLQVNFIPGSEEYLKIYSIYQCEDSTKEMGLWHIQIDSVNDLQLTSHYIKSLKFNIAYSSITYVDPIINTSIQLWKDQAIDSSLSIFTVAGTDSLNFQGKFAEFMIFRDQMEHQDNIKVHTYLAMKYGVSLMDLNYQYSDTTIIWNYSDNKSYQYEIAGIGRDDSLGIYQKQSAGNGGLSELVISAGELQITNDSNQTQLANYDALIWGNNGSELNINPDTSNIQTFNFLTERKWLMQVSGNSARQLSTNLRFSTQGLDSISNLMLVINPYCQSEYWADSSYVIMPDSSDQIGHYYFSNIQWDADSSGQDMFAFMAFPKMSINRYSSDNLQNQINDAGDFECSVFPNPTAGFFTLNYQSESELDVMLRLSTASGQIVKTQTIVQTKEFEINQYLDTPGVYFMTIDNKEKVQTFKIIVK